MTADRPGRLQWYRRTWQLAPPPPTAEGEFNRAEALAELAQIAAEEAVIPPAARTQLLEPAGPATATVVIWHGFTNAPSQFAAAGAALAEAGYRVLLPRMPYQGQRDPLTRDLAKLTAEMLVTHLDRMVDIAAGFGDPVWLAGLSGGGNLAAWAAATRPEVRRLLLIAPSVAPVGFPQPLIRFFATHPKAVPNLYWWWDPRVKEKLEGSPYAYPGFPLPGLVAYLKLTEWLLDGTVRAEPQLERVVLVTNRGDFAVRRKAARQFTWSVFGQQADYLAEARIDPELKWMHDFVEPLAPGGGTVAQVAAILLAGLGSADPSAGGVLVPPLVDPQQ